MIRLIAAIDSRRGIAKNGVQPWSLPTDERYFSDQTKRFGGALLMGQRTFTVIGQALPQRQNFVLSHEDHTAENVTYISNLEQFLDNLKTDLWVIGGASIYAQTIGVADELYLTLIEADFGCDQFFPEYKQFTLAYSDGPHEENGLKFSFNIYSRHSG